VDPGLGVDPGVTKVLEGVGTGGRTESRGVFRGGSVTMPTRSSDVKLT